MSSIFGLDFISAPYEGKREHALLEINGVDSGMSGFEKIYGDNRVENQVINSIKEEHPILYIDTGAFNNLQKYLIKRGLPHDADAVQHLARTTFPDKLRVEQRRVSQNFGRYSHTLYLGQEDGTLVNWGTYGMHKLPTVNPLVAEYWCQNKLLLDEKAKELNIPVPFVKGLIYGHKDFPIDIPMNDENIDRVIIKPNVSAQCKGIEIITKEVLRRRARTWKRPIDDVVFKDKEQTQIRWKAKLCQPFFNAPDKNGYYTSIRSIVHNGTFVDAYARASKSPLVSITNPDAIACTIDDKFKEAIKDMSEQAIDWLLHHSQLEENKYWQEQERVAS